MAIALCFLIYDKIECEDVWEEWIRGHEDAVRIYVHSKTKYTPKTDFFSKNVIQIPTIPTQWGHVSLVRATLKLYTEAYQDEKNAMFILLSGACIPIKSFQKVYGELMKTRDMSYCKNISRVSDISCRYKYLEKKIHEIYPSVPKKKVYKHPQWIVVSRNHMQFILLKENEILSLYNRIIYSDESWFLTFLSIYDKQSEIIDKYTTFTNWDINPNGAHPYTYEELSDEELNRIVNDKTCFFARKFTRNTPNLLQRLRLIW